MFLGYIAIHNIHLDLIINGYKIKHRNIYLSKYLDIVTTLCVGCLELPLRTQMSYSLYSSGSLI